MGCEEASRGGYFDLFLESFLLIEKWVIVFSRVSSGYRCGAVRYTVFTVFALFREISERKREMMLDEL